VADGTYRVVLPPVPDEWAAVLGVSNWVLEWVDATGRQQTRVIAGGNNGGGEVAAEIEVLQEWASPGVAYPYWPERGVMPEVMRPAGAIFPFDADGKRVALSWLGGVEAEVYFELAKAAGKEAVRQPQYFDWPRFKALLQSGDVPEAVRSDPWLADWGDICGKTVQSGFDRRRIVAAKREEAAIRASELGIPDEKAGGPWIGASPFAKPIMGDPLVLGVNVSVDTYFSAVGMLRVTKGARMFLFW
jgi:hypothetical protein